jgi:protein TonB
MLARVLATEPLVPLLDDPKSDLGPAAVTRPRQASGLAWALGISAALHLLVAATALAWPELVWRQPPPPGPDEDATVEVVMGESAEANGGAAAPPPAPATPPAEAPPTPPQPEHAAAAPAPPPVPTAPPPAPARPPQKPAWQTSATLGDGIVGAAELLGTRLRPAVGNQGNIPPGYPHTSAALGEQGLVVVRMTIGADGLVSAVDLLQTSGYPRLDEAALAAIAKWRFTPAVVNGAPVESRQILPVRFQLNRN